MQNNLRSKRKPAIRISQSDYDRLSGLANAIASRNPQASEDLFAELDRARTVADGRVPDDTVRMGSIVTFKPDVGDAKTVTLVFPGDADISSGKVSILTPIGTALIGLSSGQSITWSARDGRQHELQVLAVSQSEAQAGEATRSAPATLAAAS